MIPSEPNNINNPVKTDGLQADSPAEGVQPAVVTLPAARAPQNFTSTIAEGDFQSSTLNDNTADVLTPTSQEGKYRLLGEIARGGMGIVMKAEDKILHRDVAMKVMIDSGAASDNRVLRFIEEARITSMLQHPGIMPIHELGKDRNGNVFYTMKRIQGRSLKEILNDIDGGNTDVEAEYPMSRLITIFERVCDAAAYAHSKGVIHRDLKPENIMIGDFGEVLVLDWGLAKVIRTNEELPWRETGNAAGQVIPDTATNNTDPGNDSKRTPVTVHGSAIGTPGYMAPEQARGEIASTNEQSDIYSLGAILYHILALKPTISFSTNTIQTDLLEKIGTCPVAHLHTTKRIHASLAAVSMKALALRPEDRYATVKDLQADIEAYLSGFLTSAEESSVLKHISLFFNRHRVVTSISAAALILLTIGFSISIVQKMRADQAELKAFKMEKERTEEWLPVVLQDFSKNTALDSGFAPDSSPNIKDGALDFGFKSGLRSLGWVKPVGDEIMIEVRFSCSTTPFLNLTLSKRPNNHCIQFYTIGSTINLAAYGPNWKPLCSQVRTDSILRRDEPNTLIVGRKGNQLFASINGTSVLDYYYPKASRGGENSSFEISRPRTAFGPMKIHSLRVWRKQDPKYVDILEPGRAFLVNDHLASARAWFIRQSKMSPEQKTRQEAEYLITQTFTASDRSEREGLLEEIAANMTHMFRFHAMHDLAVLSSESSNWERTLSLTCETTINAPQLNTLDDVYLRLFVELRKLPDTEKQTVLRQLSLLPVRYLDLSNFGLTNIAFLKDSTITALNLDNNPVSDLNPLKGHRFDFLRIVNTRVSDLAPLAGMPLRVLNLDNTPIVDLSPLKGHSLDSLSISSCTNLDTSTLSGIKAEYLSLIGVPIRKPSILVGTGASELRLTSCDLPNIDFARLLQPKAILADNNRISDLSPLRGTDLFSLSLSHNKISDVSDLSTSVIRQCDLSNNPLSDIRALQSKEMYILNLNDTLTENISALKDMPLTELHISNTSVKDLSILSTLKNLEKLSIEGLALDNKSLESIADLNLKDLRIHLTAQNLGVVCRNRAISKASQFNAPYVRMVAEDLIPILNKDTITDEDLAALQQHGMRTGDTTTLVLPLHLRYDEASQLCKKLRSTLPCPSTPEQAKTLVELLNAVNRRGQNWTGKTWIGLTSREGQIVFQPEAPVKWALELLSGNDRSIITNSYCGAALAISGTNSFAITSHTSGADTRLVTVVEWKTPAKMN